MECSISAAYPKHPSGGSNLKTSSPPKTGLHVNFDTEGEEVSERKKKYLTAKYGQHQMSLIKKRLRVEMWMYDQLQSLYGCTDDSDNHSVEIDLDEVLDMDTDITRRQWLREKVVGAKSSRDTIEKFIDELLQRAKTL
ncbi:protein phosphatase 1 regulatory subunit 14C-like [Limulus polyphemus]|uniref:Protein phosphatase 1 regulatory subunit 14C-like n=1 Tax=Limulus polyphemus TaxID=6850 RepID=A0ABM1BIP0_LIMPO|nr:protein phosphatase 1 regulatory subunit 14C-like [Limulus polyphemus]XP_022250793.1 protein phosphatase 1 regulatory subunit 14C-like [Limulus polyphemus]